MKLIRFLFTCLACLVLTNATYAQVLFNGNMEVIDPATKWLAGWSHSMQNDAYEFKIDSNFKQEGKYSLSIAAKTNTATYGAIYYTIPHTFKGHQVQLKGYMKTENVTGYAGIWLRIDGTTAFDNMAKKNIHGTTDWTEYTTTLPYSEDEAINIVTGGLLVGNGKIWIDNLRIYIDGVPVEKATVKIPDVIKAKQDTAFSKHSGINITNVNRQQINNLALLGQVWGFVKYHHPAVAKGDFNMDAELFRVMPAVINAQNNKEACDAIEHWIDKLGAPSNCSNCKPYSGKDVAQKPNYGELFDKSVVSASLMDKLNNILANRNTGKNYYVAMKNGPGNPDFKNELPYATITYPDAGFRLLSLFRYWNMVQYFYPYRYLIGEDWNNVIAAYIPQFINARNAAEYDVAAMKLISNIHDTHGNIWSTVKGLEDYRGKYAPPFQAKFIENKLVVTAYYNDTLGVKEKIKVGDVITSINGVAITELIKKYLPLTAASNYTTQLRDMPRNYLLRANDPHFKLQLLRDGRVIATEQNGINFTDVNFKAVYNPHPKAPGFYLINDQIGYLYPGKYFNKDLPEIKKMFNDTKGIIIDMRCYPSEFMPFTFVPYIKSGNTPFVKFTSGSVDNPGLFKVGQPLNINPTAQYKGKVVVIVNEESQSQAEYTTMAFQSSPNVTVIGGTTAGADGDVSSIVLPGGISTLISGLNVLYPDGTVTQRKGVKIDEPLNPTIAGIKAGRDELLERAKAIIMAN